MGMSTWNTLERTSCKGLPLAPTTMSIPRASRSSVSRNWSANSISRATAPTPMASIAAFSAVVSGRWRR